MSGRCKGCNSILDEQEIKVKWPGTNIYTDLCFNCLPKALECLDEYDIIKKDADGTLH